MIDPNHIPKSSEINGFRSFFIIIASINILRG